MILRKKKKEKKKDIAKKWPLYGRLNNILSNAISKRIIIFKMIMKRMNNIEMNYELL